MISELFTSEIDVAKCSIDGDNWYEISEISVLGWSGGRIAGYLQASRSTIYDWLSKNNITRASNNIYCMDCLEGLRRLPHNSVALVFADPPYNIGVE